MIKQKEIIEANLLLVIDQLDGQRELSLLFPENISGFDETIGYLRHLASVGWVERSDTHGNFHHSDGYRCAQPILRFAPPYLPNHAQRKINPLQIVVAGQFLGISINRQA